MGRRPANCAGAVQYGGNTADKSRLLCMSLAVVLQTPATGATPDELFPK